MPETSKNLETHAESAFSKTVVEYKPSKDNIEYAKIEEQEEKEAEELLNNNKDTNDNNDNYHRKRTKGEFSPFYDPQDIYNVDPEMAVEYKNHGILPDGHYGTVSGEGRSMDIKTLTDTYDKYFGLQVEAREKIIENEVNGKPVYFQDIAPMLMKHINKMSTRKNYPKPFPARGNDLLKKNAIKDFESIMDQIKNGGTEGLELSSPIIIAAYNYITKKQTNR